MKKTLIALFLCTVILTSVLISCGETIVLYKEVQSYKKKDYSFKRPNSELSLDVVEEPLKQFTLPFSNETYSLQLASVDVHLGNTYDVYEYRCYETINNKRQNVGSVSFHSQTGRPVDINFLFYGKEITHAPSLLLTQEDAIAFAKGVAEEFSKTDTSAYSVRVTPNRQDPDLSLDDYVFIKKISGYDTLERITVSMSKDGKVYRLRHQAISQFEDFDKIALDRDFMTNAYDAACNEIKSLLLLTCNISYPKGSFTLENTESYLVNDGGILLLYLYTNAVYTPSKEEQEAFKTRYPLLDPGTVSRNGVAVVPIARLSSQTMNPPPPPSSPPVFCQSENPIS